MLALAGVLSEGSTGEESTAKLAHKTVGRIQFLEGFGTEGLNFLLAAGQSATSFPHQVGLTNMAGCFLQAGRERVYKHDGSYHLLEPSHRSAFPSPLPYPTS